MYNSYCIESKDFIYINFITAQFNRTLIKKILDMRGSQK